MKKILSVDDSKMVHMIIRKTMLPYDVEVLTAADGREGVQTATEQKPDLIILDATMPVMDGIEALAALKASDDTKGIPVVMLSADSSQDNMDKAIELGALTFISKPFSAEKLLEGIGPYIALAAKV